MSSLKWKMFCVINKQNDDLMFVSVDKIKSTHNGMTFENIMYEQDDTER